MTDKEQIILDEIEEIIAPYQEEIEPDTLSLPSAVKSIIERKTQECEKLRKKLRKLELENTTLQNRYQQVAGATTNASRYRKALDEIEEIVGMCLEFDSSMKRVYYIINKAKEKTND